MRLMLGAFWFFLPAGVANMTPVFANYIPLLNRWRTPMDFGAKWHDQRLLGDSKSWRGLAIGSLLAGVTATVVYGLVFKSGLPLAAFGFGIMLGFGALLGDAVGSFFKRRLRIPPGRSWFPFDQLDYILGGLLFIYPFTRLPLNIIVMIIVLYFGLHLLTGYIAYLLGLKNRPI